MEEKHKAPFQCLTRNVNNFWIPEPISFLQPLSAKARQYVNPTPLYTKLCQVTMRHSIQSCSEDIVPARDEHIARDTLAICTSCILSEVRGAKWPYNQTTLFNQNSWYIMRTYSSLKKILLNSYLLIKINVFIYYITL